MHCNLFWEVWFSPKWSAHPVSFCEIYSSSNWLIEESTKIKMWVDQFAINLFVSPQILASSIFPMVSTGLCNSCSTLTLNFLGFFLCYLLTSARISRGWWCEVIIKTHFWPFFFWLFFFWLYQFPHPAHSSALLAAGGKACHNTRVEQAAECRNFL